MERVNLEYFLAQRIAARGGANKTNVMVRIASVSVAIGIAVMIISLSVIFGFKEQIASKLAGFGAHVQLVHLDNNTSYERTPIPLHQEVIPLIEALPNCTGVSPYAIKAGLLRTEEAMQGVVLKGVDTSYNRTFFEQCLTTGELPKIGAESRSKEVLISQMLADLLLLEVGDPIEMLFIEQPPRRDRFRISGIYDTQFGEMDRMMVLTDIRNVQRLNNWDSTRITGFEITTESLSQVDDFAEQIEELLYQTPPAENISLRALSLREQFPMIFDWLDAHDLNAVVIIVVMLLVALFNMVSALLILLLERTTMIGTLKTLGMSNRSLQKMFIIRSSFVILQGMFWGNLLGVGLCLLQQHTGWITLDQAGYFLTTVPIALGWGWWVLLNGACFLLLVSLLALPTMIISLILPEKSVRFS